MGLGAIATMALAVKSETGGLLDLRSSTIALAGFFGGPVAGGIAALFALSFRITVGGPSVWLGVIGIMFAAVVGVAASRATYKRVPAIAGAGLLALSVACIGPALSMIFVMVGLSGASNGSLPLALLNGAATALSAFFFMRQRVVERERDLLRAAFMQSSDFQYVKGPDSRFTVVNKAVAKHHGFDNPADMIGRSDFDLAEADRADGIPGSLFVCRPQGRPCAAPSLPAVARPPLAGMVPLPHEAGDEEDEPGPRPRVEDEPEEEEDDDRE